MSRAHNRAMAAIKLEPVRTDTLQDRVYAKLRQALSTGVFAPGQPITIRGLAEALGTSTMPVREALNRLVAERALEALPNRTLRVPEMSALLLTQLHDIRCALEGLATEQATSNLSAGDLDRLDALCREMAGAVRRRDVEGYLARNYAFHLTIYKASRNPPLVGLIEGVWLRIGPFVRLIFDSAGLAMIPEVHHREAAAALRAGDADAARAAIERDIKDAATFYLGCGKLPAEEPRANAD